MGIFLPHLGTEKNRQAGQRGSQGLDVTPLSEDNEKVRSLEQRKGMARRCEREASGRLGSTGYPVRSTEPVQQLR